MGGLTGLDETAAAPASLDGERDASEGPQGILLSPIVGCEYERIRIDDDAQRHVVDLGEVPCGPDLHTLLLADSPDAVTDAAAQL
jgi:hypothetical protein